MAFKHPGTFSIVAYDPANGDLGVAVASKFLAVGSVVPFAQAGVGAIATQAFANTTYGPKGLELLKKGTNPTSIIRALTSEDINRDSRQVGIIDAKGRSATYTGKQCMNWAGGIAGRHYAVQGNILTSKAVVEGMARAFKNTQGELAVRLIAALEAAEAAGGDSRGKQSASILVVRKNGGYAGFNDRYLDLRVDDNPEPVQELKRLVGLMSVIQRGASADRLYNQKKYAEAARAYLTILKDAPDNAIIRYNLACALALAGRKSEALEHLKHAIELDGSLKALAQRDPDFVSIKNDEQFKRITGE